MKKIILGAGAVCAASLLAGAVESHAIELEDITIYEDEAAWETAVNALEADLKLQTEAEVNPQDTVTAECAVTTENCPADEDGDGGFNFGTTMSVYSEYNNLLVDPQYPVPNGPGDDPMGGPMDTGQARCEDGKWLDRIVFDGVDGYTADTTWTLHPLSISSIGPAKTYAFGADWDLGPFDPGSGINIEACDGNACVTTVYHIPGNATPGFLGFVSATPFDKVVLSATGAAWHRETFTMEDMVRGDCAIKVEPYTPPCESGSDVDVRALINIDRTEPYHDRARFRIHNAEGVPYGVCTGDFNLTLSVPGVDADADGCPDVIFNTDWFNTDGYPDADIHCHCNQPDNCFVFVRKTDIDQNKLDEAINNPATPIRLDFRVDGNDYHYTSVDDWRQQDSGSTTDTPDDNKSQWSKFRTP